MVFIVLAVLISLISLYYRKWLHKNQLFLYIGAIILGLMAYLGREIKVTDPLNNGIVGLAFFYTVMIVGVLPKTWKITLALRGLRKEWSIVGFILIAPHSIFNLYQMLFNSKPLTWFGIATFVMMIPLMITSFTLIRKKMTSKTWKNMQSFAYIAYGALFIHLILNASNTQNLVAYVLTFTPYVIFKVHIIIKQHSHKKSNKPVNQKTLTNA